MHDHCLPCVEHATSDKPDASIIWLHGLGADGHDFEPIVDELKLPGTLRLRFVFPHAPSMPVSINNGYIMPAWYDVRQSDFGVEQDEAGIRQSARSIRLLVEHEIMRGIQAERIVLAGFSQGGAMALHTGLRFDQRLAAIMALSAYLTLPDTLAAEAHEANAKTPIFMAHGVQDAIVPFDMGDTSRRRLQAMGHALAWHAYPMGHGVCPEEIRAISTWLQTVLV